MKSLMIVLFPACMFNFVFCQIEVGVWTDKPIYNYGDTVSITVTSYNPLADTVNLTFGSTCQATYVIDSFYLSQQVGCGQIITSRFIPPHFAVRWDPFYYPYTRNVPPLAVGAHVVIGQVIGYGSSDTLVVFVTLPVSHVNTGRGPETGALLMPNYPNPFNGSTTIPFTLMKAGRVTINIYNNLGQKLRTVLDDYRSAGTYSVTTDLNEFPSGLYWCRLQSEGKSQTTRLVMAK